MLVKVKSNVREKRLAVITSDFGVSDDSCVYVGRGDIYLHRSMQQIYGMYIVYTVERKYTPTLSEYMQVYINMEGQIL